MHSSLFTSQSSRPSSATVIILGAIVLGIFSGCGNSGGRLPVSGSVTLDGVPLANGEIIFVPISGTKGPTAAGEILAGKFKIPAAKGPIAGSYRVEITAERATGRKITGRRSILRNGRSIRAISARQVQRRFGINCQG